MAVLKDWLIGHEFLAHVTYESTLSLFLLTLAASKLMANVPAQAGKEKFSLKGAGTVITASILPFLSV